jgi:2-succinyl-6-hydroxy-2,4-cyclohexadiene-1-carboxylate synthase
LLEKDHPWDAAMIIAAHPGLENEEEKVARREKDTNWSVKCLHGEWEEFLQEWQAQGILQEAGSLSDRVPLRLRRKEIARSFLDWSLGAQENLWQRLPEIEVPVLWLTGERDTKFSAIATRAVTMMPNARHQVIANAGHRLPWQEPIAFSQVLMEFISSLATKD